MGMLTKHVWVDWNKLQFVKKPALYYLLGVFPTSFIDNFTFIIILCFLDYQKRYYDVRGLLHGYKDKEKYKSTRIVK